MADAPVFMVNEVSPEATAEFMLDLCDVLRACCLRVDNLLNSHEVGRPLLTPANPFSLQHLQT